MQRVLPVAAGLAALFVGCGAPPRFQDMRTPSGEFCTDMPIYAGKDIPDREFHRLEPIQSAPSARTEPERLRSLRQAACYAGGDAVIEAIEEEIRLPDASYGKVAAGTAIVWTRREGAAPKPLGLGTKGTGDKPAEVVGDEKPTELAPPKEPTPVNTAVEVKSPPPPPSATATATATAAATTPPPAPTGTGTTTTTKTKTTTKTTTKK